MRQKNKLWHLLPFHRQRRHADAVAVSDVALGRHVVHEALSDAGGRRRRHGLVVGVLHPRRVAFGDQFLRDVAEAEKSVVSFTFKQLSDVKWRLWHYVTFRDIMWRFVSLCDVSWYYVTFHDILWHFLTFYFMWHFIWCDALWHYMTFRDVLWNYMTFRDIMWCFVTLCDVLGHYVTFCDIMWCSVTLYVIWQYMLCDILWHYVMFCDVM